MVGEVPAGELVERYVYEHPDTFISLDRVGTAHGEHLFGLRLAGESMEPWMFDGDVAICSSVQSVQVGDDVALYQQATGHSTVKRLTGLNQRKRTIHLTPLNPHPRFQPFHVEMQPEDQLRRVLYVWRDVQQPREP